MSMCLLALMLPSLEPWVKWLCTGDPTIKSPTLALQPASSAGRCAEAVCVPFLLTPLSTYWSIVDFVDLLENLFLMLLP